MRKFVKQIVIIAVIAILHMAMANAGNLTVNGNLTVTTNAIVNGKVGIGTASPSDALDINGGFRVSGASTATSGSGLEMDYSVFGPRIFGYDRDHAKYLPVGIGNFTTGNGFLVQSNGFVGIGTVSPAAMLDIRPLAFSENQTGNRGVQLACTDGHYPSGMFLRTDSAGQPRLSLDIDTVELITAHNNGNVGIGSTYPVKLLDTSPLGSVVDMRAIPFSNNAGGGLQLSCTGGQYPSGLILRTDSGGFAHLDLDGPGAIGAMSIIGSGNVGIGTYNPQSALDVRGTTTTCILTITGGCDLSEPFKMSSTELPRGSIVVIDAEHPGELKLSQRAYDTRVAGIISGANGIKPGISLHQEGVLEGGQNVALSGRVYALADAFYGSIQPGDLLTTSDTPGHCMKVADHARAQGSIIGKAMSGLSEGKGMVLVLVTLQ